MRYCNHQCHCHHRCIHIHHPLRSLHQVYRCTNWQLIRHTNTLSSHDVQALDSESYCVSRGGEYCDSWWWRGKSRRWNWRMARWRSLRTLLPLVSGAAGQRNHSTAVTVARQAESRRQETEDDSLWSAWMSSLSNQAMYENLISSRQYSSEVRNTGVRTTYQNQYETLVRIWAPVAPKPFDQNPSTWNLTSVIISAVWHCMSKRVVPV